MCLSNFLLLTGLHCLTILVCLRCMEGKAEWYAAALFIALDVLWWALFAAGEPDQEKT